MTAATRRTKPWDTPEYRHIVTAKADAGELVVRFGDGAEVRLDVARMPRVQERGPDWSALRFNDFEVIVPTRAGDFEIPWLPIRSLTDPAFRAHLDAAAGEQARQVGQRIRSLRERCDLDIEMLAERAGVAPSTLERIEAGATEINLPALEAILTGMGHTWADLLAESTERLFDLQPR